MIVRTGEIQNDVRLLDSGIARGYFLNINGKEVTDCFVYHRGEGIMSYYQLELDIPSPMTIEMLEDGGYYYMPISEVIELQEYYPEIIRLYNRLLMASLNMHWRLQQVLNQFNATQRYQWFLEEYPGLIKRVSNKYIASYIGMTPVTLSRIRRNLKDGMESEESKTWNTIIKI